MPTIATLFSGGGGFDVGAVMAGYTPVFALDFDANAAHHYARNLGDHIVVSDVRYFDWSTVQAVDHLHASPSCKNASTANAKAGETEFDIECALSILKALDGFKPATFSLENVWSYRSFLAFKILLRGLSDRGYNLNYWRLNAADYGVPQTRERLILLGDRRRIPQMPIPTHARTPDQTLSLFGDKPKLPWVGWYEAIADLIPHCNPVRLNKRQSNRMAIVAGKPMLIEKDGARNDRALAVLQADQPCYTVRALGGDGHWQQFTILHGDRAYTPSTRALARLQSFLDSYWLSDRTVEACQVIGNAVPPLLAKAIMEGFR